MRFFIYYCTFFSINIFWYCYFILFDNTKTNQRKDENGEISCGGIWGWRYCRWWGWNLKYWRDKVKMDCGGFWGRVFRTLLLRHLDLPISFILFSSCERPNLPSLSVSWSALFNCRRPTTIPPIIVLICVSCDIHEILIIHIQILV